MQQSIFPNSILWRIEQRTLGAVENARQLERELSAEILQDLLPHFGVAKSGLAEVARQRGAGGEPLWPAGVCGSIAHTRLPDQTVAALCALGPQAMRSLGVDLEWAARPLRPGLARRICAGRETITSAPELLRLFSAKEATFKLFYPLTRTFFGFKQAELLWSESEQNFSGRLLTTLGEFSAGFPFVVRSMQRDQLQVSLALLAD